MSYDDWKCTPPPDPGPPREPTCETDLDDAHAEIAQLHRTIEDLEVELTALKALKADDREFEEYPGELRELRAVLRSIAVRGCLACQLRASVARSRSHESPRPVSPPTLRLVKE